MCLSRQFSIPFRRAPNAFNFYIGVQSRHLSYRLGHPRPRGRLLCFPTSNSYVPCIIILAMSSDMQYFAPLTAVWFRCQWWVVLECFNRRGSLNSQLEVSAWTLSPHSEPEVTTWVHSLNFQPAFWACMLSLNSQPDFWAWILSLSSEPEFPPWIRSQSSEPQF